MKNSSIQANLFKPTCWLETKDYLEEWIESVSKELNHLAAILNVYAGSLIFMK